MDSDFSRAMINLPEFILLPTFHNQAKEASFGGYFRC